MTKSNSGLLVGAAFALTITAAPAAEDVSSLREKP
jgi:hypothetical protein